MLYFLKSERGLAEALEQSNSFHDIFELVQRATMRSIGETRAGLNLGIMEMGNKEGQFLGAFYPAESNIIVLNNTPLRRITETNEQLFKPYLFFVMLHEYLHSLGYLDEQSVRELSTEICRQNMGEDHDSTQMAMNIEKFFPNLIYPGGFPPKNDKMLLIEDLDKGMDYVD